jgi:hypothetical protein
VARRTANRALVARCVTGIAIAAADLGDNVRAATLLGAGERTYKLLGIVPEFLEAQLPDKCSDQLRAVMGDAAFDHAHADGSEMPDAEALALAAHWPAVG